MELKDVILSTLAEMEDNEVTKKILKQSADLPDMKEKKNFNIEKSNKESQEHKKETSSFENEVTYLNSIRERLLVLFEGFQAPNNTNIEAKIDLTLNFLEYILATIDNRIEKLEKGNSSESI